MRLVHLDVDRYGTNDRCELGPLSPGLNAIGGPRGAGKTTLLSWLRAVAEENHGSFDALAKSGYQAPPPLSGSVEIYNHGRRCRVISDRNGRVKFEPLVDRWSDPYGHTSPATDSGRPLYGNAEAYLNRIQADAFAGLAAANGTTDTELALEQLAQRLGIDALERLGDSRRELLESRRRELETSLQRATDQPVTNSDLATRRQQLESELHSSLIHHGAGIANGSALDERRLQDRRAAIEADLRGVLNQIQELDRVIAEKAGEIKLLEAGQTKLEVGDSYRVQLQQLDDRLNRWRQTLRDLKSHRESIEHDTTDAQLDRQIGDQLAPTKDCDPRAAMRSLEAQILNTRRQLDSLVERYVPIPGYDYRSASAAITGTGYQAGQLPTSHGVYRDASGRTYVGHPLDLPQSSLLPETLRSMQSDLQEVCQQLARHESKTATDTLRQQSSQLKRCEQELLQSIERLIEERAELLRRVASEHHLSVEQLNLAFGSWCQCHDHAHLQDWLASEECAAVGNQETAIDPAVRGRLIDELDALKRNRRDASLQADEFRRQLRDNDMRHRSIVDSKVEVPRRTTADIQHDLDQVTSELSRLADRDRLQAELADVIRQLQTLPQVAVESTSRWRALTDRHVAGLMGADRGTVSRREVPAALVRTAMRLAIAEALKDRGEPICTVLDGPLDGIPFEIQQTAVAHLAAVSGQGQQVIVLTSDQRVVELVQSARGWVGHLGATTRSDPDINRHLSALANDEEAGRWYTPLIPARDYRGARSEYYLSDRSLIEDLPSIDPAAAARCRAAGVDRIGDLLDVDPNWLADVLHADGISYRVVTGWQAEACLFV